MAHIGICLPFYHTIHPATMRALEQLEGTSEHSYALHMWKGDPNVDHARAMALGDWLLDARHTHLLTLDSDVWWSPGSIDRLVVRELPVICGAYPFKAPQGTGLHNRVVGVRMLDDAASGLQRMRYIGSGFCLYRAGVIRRLCNLHPELRFNLPAHEAHNAHLAGRTSYALWLPQIIPHTEEDGTVSREYQTDDWSLCQRLHDAGYDIWLDLTIRLRHCGPGQEYYELEEK